MKKIIIIELYTKNFYKIEARFKKKQQKNQTTVDKKGKRRMEEKNFNTLINNQEVREAQKLRKVL